QNYERLATSEVEFIATEEDGIVSLDFLIDARSHEGHRIVAIEKLYLLDGEEEGTSTDELKKSTPIATHEDLNDEDQSIYVTSGKEKSQGINSKEKFLAKTSDMPRRYVWIGLGLLGISFVALRAKKDL
ncbi:MAG: hypothetical protein IJV62_02800, partial [Eggerthellaceae bacterium]|nr:hypothetical protein [Eggerthellaceae bacterium]